MIQRVGTMVGACRRKWKTESGWLPGRDFRPTINHLATPSVHNSVHGEQSDAKDPTSPVSERR